MSQLTYQIAQPAATHWRKATCAEVDCQWHKDGWVSVIDTNVDAARAHYIRKESGRKFRESGSVMRCTEEGVWYEEILLSGVVAFVFEPGQTCFAAADHKVPLDRPQIFRVAPTMHGRVVGEVRTHRTGADWVDDMSTHLDHLRTLRERG